MHRVLAAFLLTAIALATPALAAGTTIHEATFAEVDLGQALPPDLVDPEGKTRWELGGVTLSTRWVETIATDSESGRLLVSSRPTEIAAAAQPRRTLHDRSTPGDAERWLLPHRDARLLNVEELVPIELHESRGAETARLWIQTRRVGIGWVFLPSGPREVVLQRALVMRGEAGGDSLVAETLIHRWVDPRAGVVAEIRGPASADGRGRVEITSASVVESFGGGGEAPIKLYADQLTVPIRTTVRYGYDREKRCSVGGNLCRTTDECAGGADQCAEIPVSSLIPSAPVTIGELACDPDGMSVCQATSWDFSANNLTNFPAMEELVSITTDVSAEETSAFGECGFTSAGRVMSREDKNPSNPDVGNNDGDLNITASVLERTDGECSISRGACVDNTDCLGGETCDPDVSHQWLRAAIRNEGIPGLGLLTESRTCHDSVTGRTPVPLWRFGTVDAMGTFAQAGDTWANSSQFDCEQTIFANFLVTNTGYVKSCDSSIGTLEGEQRGIVVNEGPVTLPSGHTFNALVLHSVVEYCVYPCSNCGGLFCGAVSEVRTVLYLWEVPHIGTVARLMSSTEAPSRDAFTSLDETDIKYGLFPPRAITVVDDTMSDSIEISWDPGLITGHIDRYRVYWDTQSGAATGGNYAFDSGPGGTCSGSVCTGDGVTACGGDPDCSNPNVTFGADSAVIGGLTPGTPYFFTVTAVSDFCPPAICANNPCSPTCPSPQTNCGTLASPCPEPLIVESLKFPTQVGGGPAPVPAEVSATPGGACQPTVEVANTMVGNRIGSGDVQLCWDPVADGCAEGYRILGAASPELAANFSPVVDIGLATCHTFASSDGYFIVVGNSSAGTGPMGHFGQ